MAGRGQRGFTLPEVLVSVAVSSALLAFAYQFFVGQQRSYVLQEQLADAQQNARIATEELTRYLASLGAGAELERGQVRLLVAHPYEVVFTADLSDDYKSGAPGAAVPGAGRTDPYPTYPAGSYDASSRAETYRFTLDRNGDGRVDAADRTQGEHYTLYREVNGGNLVEVATLLANPRVGEPLLRYWGDLNGTGRQEAASRVDRTTSTRVAAGESLDAVVRRIEVNVLTEAASADPTYPVTGGYRQVRLTTSVTPQNLRTP